MATNGAPMQANRREKRRPRAAAGNTATKGAPMHPKRREKR
jgi:hypothetical protein